MGDTDWKFGDMRRDTLGSSWFACSPHEFEHSPAVFPAEDALIYAFNSVHSKSTGSIGGLGGLLRVGDFGGLRRDRLKSSSSNPRKATPEGFSRPKGLSKFYRKARSFACIQDIAGLGDSADVLEKEDRVKSKRSRDSLAQELIDSVVENGQEVTTSSGGSHPAPWPQTERWERRNTCTSSLFDIGCTMSNYVLQRAPLEMDQRLHRISEDTMRLAKSTPLALVLSARSSLDHSARSTLEHWEVCANRNSLDMADTEVPHCAWNPVDLTTLHGLVAVELESTHPVSQVKTSSLHGTQCVQPRHPSLDDSLGYNSDIMEFDGEDTEDAEDQAVPKMLVPDFQTSPLSMHLLGI